jgi:type I restriction-modification system DNA methylase subunit
MPSINTSLELKKLLLDKTGEKFQVTKLTRDSPKSAKEAGDFCIEVKPPLGFEIDIEFVDTILSDLKINNTYSKINLDTCCLLLSTWNSIIDSGEDLNQLIARAIVEEVIVPKSTQSNKTQVIRDLVEQILNENRTPTEAERELLISYEGIGGLAKEGVRGQGILSEFYTPDEIIQKMWGLAYKNGFVATGKVLEPSCGTGRFFKYHNPSLIDAFEIDSIAYNIAKLLYPRANITLGSFETKFFRGNFHLPKTKGDYDLVIGNPPYESFVSQYSPKEKTVTEAVTFDQYFITRGLDLLKIGGLMVFIIPSSFMRNDNKYNKIKEEIHAKAELIEAYRLPNNVFPNTYIGTDILVFRKHSWKD